MGRGADLSHRIALVVVGDELLDGRVQESNSTFLIQELTAAGCAVASVVVVPDDITTITEAMRRAQDQASVVLVTGGLGPTPDDVNREALARVLGEPLEEDPAVVEGIRARFQRRGRSMPDSNRRQAARPRSSAIIPNANGTAPGLWAENRQGVLVLMPGVPEEMHRMWRDSLRERVVARGGGRAHPKPRLRVTQVSESWLSDRVAEVLAGAGDVQVSYCVQRFGIDLLVHAEASREADVVGRLKAALGARIYAEGDAQLNEVVLQTLNAAGATLATAESCTGGLLGASLTEPPGSSQVYRGGVVAYADDVKSTQLGVDAALLAEHGAVSEPVVCAMASAVRQRLDADWGVSISGVAGPGGGTAAKPVGTIWVGVAGPDGVTARQLRLPGDRAQNRRWSTAAALDDLRGRLR